MFQHQLYVGGSVFWDCSGTHDPHHIVEGEVLELDEDTVVVVRIRTWHPGSERIEPRDVYPRQQPSPMPRSFFDVPLEDRLGDTKRFWAELGGMEA